MCVLGRSGGIERDEVVVSTGDAIPRHENFKTNKKRNKLSENNFYVLVKVTSQTYYAQLM